MLVWGPRKQSSLRNTGAICFFHLYLNIFTHMEKSSILPCPDKICFEKPPLFYFTDPWTKIELVNGMICFSCVLLVAPVKLSSSLYSFVLQDFSNL
jgi:hypothetical protein